MAHTPGPWTPEGPVAYGYNIYAVRSGVWIGDACGPHDGTPGFPGDEEANANAHLIAAAPDMLEVAKAYEAWETDLLQTQEAWETPDGYPRMTPSLYDRWMEIQEMRNRALRKARGEEVG